MLQILVEMVLLCSATYECPEHDQSQYEKVEAYLEENIEGIDFEIKPYGRVDVPSNLTPNMFHAKELNAINEGMRSHYGHPIQKEDLLPSHIYGFMVNSRTEFAGLADPFKNGNSFYMNTKFDHYPKIIAHEILHLLGFAHTEDRKNIMNPGYPCPAFRDMDKCKVTFDNMFWNEKGETYPEYRVLERFLKNRGVTFTEEPDSHDNCDEHHHH